MSAEILLVIFVGVTAVAFLLQGISVWHTSRNLSRTLEQVRRQSENLERETSEVMLRLREVADSLEPVGEIAENVGKNIHTISDTIHHRFEDFDRFVQEVLKTGQDQASKIDFVVTDTARKFTETTETLQKDILRPAIEVSSMIKGVKAGLEYLFQKKSPKSRKEYEEEQEELFI